jgi:multidrug efflux pump subunit AcrA (membrane-fusion protein)
MENFRAVIAATVIFALVGGCGKPSQVAEPIRPVRAIKVGDLKAINSREFPGRAEAKDAVELSFQVAGPLISLPIDVGSTVKKGDLIAAIDPRDFRTALASNQGNLERARANLLAMERGARPEEIEQLKAAVEQAESSYKQAKAEHERNADLIVTGAVSQSEFDISLARKERTTAEVKSAKEALNIGMSGARPEDLEAKRSEIRALEADVTAAKNQLEYATLTAPFGGEVAARYVDNFQTVQAKQSIVRLLDVSKIEITVQIPETLIGLVPQVRKAACRFDAIPGREFFGKVTKIGREASLTTRTYPVTVEIEQPEDARILPGMAAMVRNHREEGEAPPSEDLIVPPTSVFTAADEPQTYVWIVDGGNKVTRRVVETGELTLVGLKVAEGLKPGEVVVTSGVNMLREGQEVKLQ